MLGMVVRSGRTREEVKVPAFPITLLVARVLLWLEGISRTPAFLEDFSSVDGAMLPMMDLSEPISFFVMLC